MNQKVREQWSRPARAAFLRTALIGGARDVEVRPFQPLCELAQKRGCGDRAAFPSADVREIREITLELIGVLLGEREMPGAIVRPHSGLHELLDEGVIVS